MYAALTLAEGRGLSTSGLVESLDLSRASIRNAARFLVGIGIGERYRVPDSREACYRMTEGVWGPILAKKATAIGEMRGTPETALDCEAPEEAPPRLQEMHDVSAFFVEAFEEIMQRVNERTSS